MTIKSDLETSLKDAMRSGNDVRKRTIRMAIAAIRFNEVEKGSPLDEAGEIAIMQKEVKSRQEAIADAQRAGRPELAAAAQEEILILEGFLPKPFSPDELASLAREAVAEAGATSPADMGKVMKILTPRLQGRATGTQASQVVRTLLQNP
jgi:uncharacterized protein